jgi:hypothetical protein
MPKVRASSATIGTTRGPSVSSFRSCDSSCTNTMVVDWFLSLDDREGTEKRGASLERAGR